MQTSAGEKKSVSSQLMVIFFPFGLHVKYIQRI